VSAPAGALVFPVLREGLLLVLVLSGPPLLASLLAGFLLGVFQGATQIQDPTLAFVPKLVVVMLTLIAMGPILGAQLIRFTQAVFVAVAGLR
jgi:type III secretory pathway component EscS